MSRKIENVGFVCENCNEVVFPLDNGSYRNHCPVCLYSKHVDIKPGDRLNKCQGLMMPISIKISSKKGIQIVHKCLTCNEIKVNKIAEHSIQPDDFSRIIKLMSFIKLVSKIEY